MNELTDGQIELYQAIHDAREPRVYEHWHASSIAECPRAQYFKRLGIPAVNLPSAAKMLRWDGGHALEEAVRPHIKTLYPDVKSNVRFVNEHLDLTGEYDNYSKKHKKLIEIKSVSDYAFKEQEGITALKQQLGTHPNGNRKWGLKLTPYLHHEIQQHALVALGEYKVEKIKYIYISLHGRIVVYETEVKEGVSGLVHKRLEKLNKAWADQEPPKCLCSQTDHPLYESVMQWCDYKEEGRCCDLSLIKEKK